MNEHERVEPAMPEVVCMGEILVDLIEAERGGDPFVFQMHFGGAPANVAVNLSRLGTSVSLFATVGRDWLGEFLTSELQRSGVDTSALQVINQRNTSVALIRVVGGEPQFAFYRDAGADYVYSLGEAEMEKLDNAAFFHIGSFSLSREPFATEQRRALRQARSRDAVVTCDLNLRREAWRNVADMRKQASRLAAEADVLKLTRRELELLTGRADPEAAQELLGAATRLVIVTLGSGGCYFRRKSSGGYVPALAATMADPVGAGDGFCAGLIHAIVRSGARARIWEASDEELRSWLRFAHAVGACVIAESGAIPSELSEQTVELLVRRSEAAAIRGVILFDIDGTLLDSRDIGKRAIELAVQEVLGHPVDIKDLVFDGYTDPYNVNQVLEHEGVGSARSDSVSQDILSSYLKYLRAHVTKDRPQVLPGVLTLLNQLSSRRDLVLGLLTGNTSEAALLKLTSVGLDSYFAFGVYGSEKYSRYDLPALAQQRAKELLGLSPRPTSFVVVGDTVHDMKAAKQFGARAIGVLTGGEAPEALRNAGADYVLCDLAATQEFLSALEELLTGTES